MLHNFAVSKINLDTKRLKWGGDPSSSMSFAEAKNQSNLTFEIKSVDFEERPICQSCKSPMIIRSHSSPSLVAGFEGKYYTKYREYTCGDTDCPQYRKKKYRAPNPWRVDRHKCDLEVEAEVVHLRFQEKKTGQEILKLLENNHGIQICEKTVGNICLRYEMVSKSENEQQIDAESQKNGGVLVEVDAMAPVKGEDKHITAIDQYSNRTLLVEQVCSENTEVHIAFQEKLKNFTAQHNLEVVGFMSDDHVPQRKAIRKVWGPEMKHCRCRFHFEKRVLEEPFKLNRSLNTKVKARLRKIGYVIQYRVGNLKPIENSKVWAYLLAIIEDLVTLQTWKTKRNDTNLESIIFYSRVDEMYHLLLQLQNQLSALPTNMYPRETRRLKILLKHLQAILTDYKQQYEDLLRIQGHQAKVKAILDAHEDPSEVGLKELTELAKNLEARLNSGKITCKAEKDYIEKLCAFVFDRGESLFHYRDIKNANNTNNSQESKFKTLKWWIKRTQGIASGSQYLQKHAKYLLFVDPNASREEIRQILMHADYKAIAQMMKEERALSKRPLLKIKDTKKWESKKQSYKAKLLEI